MKPYLPTGRCNCLNSMAHVFVDVVTVYDRVQLELDTPVAAPVGDLKDFGFMNSPAVLASSNPQVGVVVERIAGYTHDVEI